MNTTIPQEFLDYAHRLLGEARYARLEAALTEPASVSIRLNPMKCGLAGLRSDTVSGYDELVPWATGGMYLRERPSFTADPLLHSGAYYVQEASSMFLEQAVRRYVKEPVRALDLCAAPGGKSTHLRALLPEGSLLVSNEPIRARANVLAENMTKWGHPDVVVTNSYPADFAPLEDFFDLMVTDVPCSGEGMFRKEEDAVTGWSRDAVMMCRDRQRAILRDVWSALRPGGLLVYSTCTLNQYEDEENVAWIACELGADVLPLDVPQEWGVTGYLPAEAGEIVSVCHLVQGLVRGEGFFLAVLRKHGESGQQQASAYRQADKRKSKNKKDGGKAPAVPTICKAWLKSAVDWAFFPVGDEWHAVNPVFRPWVERLQETVKVMQAGVAVASLKGHDMVPDHALALSSALEDGAFPQVELPYADAVAYLHRETVMLPSDTPRGYVLLTFSGVPIGFAKNLGNRANNLYPQEWRIRSGHLPDFTLNCHLAHP